MRSGATMSFVLCQRLSFPVERMLFGQAVLRFGQNLERCRCRQSSKTYHYQTFIKYGSTALYQPLQASQREIRLAVIEPAGDRNDSDSPIRFSLDYAFLSDPECISYEALSYCRGEPDLDAKIIALINLDSISTAGQKPPVPESRDTCDEKPAFSIEVVTVCRPTANTVD